MEPSTDLPAPSATEPEAEQSVEAQISAIAARVEEVVTGFNAWTGEIAQAIERIDTERSAQTERTDEIERRLAEVEKRASSVAPSASEAYEANLRLAQEERERREEAARNDDGS